ncbi:MAG TPA: TIR domain-containing protein [Candidatus Kapabacteria bacterium]|nr:TIR domain-containing protein [Candidatus Kapabacteria bacterium]
MPHDIFISYSRKDSAQARQLAELLTSAGLSCWIDKEGIDLAMSWSGEIVDAINECQAFVVLLSANSLGSHNVMKEVALASEKRKKILPLDLEPVTLTRDFEYQLAGIQRASMTNIDAVIRALGKLGLMATGMTDHAPTVKIVKETDSRKSLMILPFEDLSPTADNAWFTDGIVSEMISALSNVKALRIADAQTTKEFKAFKGHLTTYAREMNIRYFVQGDVRKFGDTIKIMARLLDIETGDHLWQLSMKGVMDDIFDIQEQVAAKVVEGLKVHLAADEKKKLAEHGTENAEAYELFLKAKEYYSRHTKSDFERALALYEEAVRMDPRFAAAYAQIANTCQALYRFYDRSESLLTRGEAAAGEVGEIEGKTAQYFWVRSRIELCRGNAESGLQFAQSAVENDPAFAEGYDALGGAYKALGLRDEAAQAWEEWVRLKENYMTAHFSLLIALNERGDSPEAREQLRNAAERAMPLFERHVRLNPDDYNAQVLLANIFQFAGREAEARAEADKLSAIQSLDGLALYHLACLYLECHDLEHGMAMLRRSVKKDFRNIEHFRRDPALDALRGTPEFEELVRVLEKAQQG